MRRDPWDYEDYSQRQSENGDNSFGKLFLLLFLLQDTHSKHVPPLIRFVWITLLGIPFIACGILGAWIPTVILGILLLGASIAGGASTPLSFTKVFARIIWLLMSAVLILLALKGLYPMLLAWWFITIVHIVNYEII